MTDTLFAFWRYDQYPYVLGGTVTEIEDNGAVWVKEYARYFKPIKIMPEASGKALLAELKALEQEYLGAQKKALAEAKRLLKEVMPEALP